MLRALPFLLLLAACARRPAGTILDAPTPRNDSQAEHLVQSGESWERISEIYFGDGTRAGRIAAESGGRIAVDPTPGKRIQVRIAPDEMELVRRMELARGSYNEGVELLRAGDRDRQALAAFEQALEVAPHFIDAHYNRGLVLLRLELGADAVQELRTVAKARPRDKDVHYALASAHFQQEEYELALRALDAALSLDGKFLRAQYTRAMALTKLGRAKEAGAAWRRYLELDSASAWAVEARRQLEGL